MSPSASDEAAAALRSAAATIDTTTEARVRLAVQAQQDWVGRTRATFDDELRRHVRWAADLASACRAAASRLEAAAEDARLEQRRASYSLR